MSFKLFVFVFINFLMQIFVIATITYIYDINNKIC